MGVGELPSPNIEEVRPRDADRMCAFSKHRQNSLLHDYLETSGLTFLRSIKAGDVSDAVAFKVSSFVGVSGI